MTNYELQKTKQSKECGRQITWRTSSACLVYDNDRKSILFFTPQVLITWQGKNNSPKLQKILCLGTYKLYIFDDK